MKVLWHIIAFVTLLPQHITIDKVLYISLDSQYLEQGSYTKDTKY